MNSKNKPASSQTSLFQTKFERLENGNLEVVITIPWSVVETGYNQALIKTAAETTLKGFRKGKAPREMVEKNLGRKKIFEAMIPDLLTQGYVAALKNHDLHPIINPRFELVKAEDNTDWELKATTAELPKIELGDYKTKLKKELAPEKIWVPGKDTDDQKDQPTGQEQMSKTFRTLVGAIKFEVAPLIVDEEVTRLISRLIDQTARLGITVDQYLQSIGKTSQQLREEYRQQAEEAVRLELILAAIANEEKITVTDQEVDEMIEASGDAKVKDQLKKPEQQVYLRQVLRKRKVIDILTSL